MNKPLISIVIPVYNYAHVVARALHSVIPQLDDATELLIINDGSSDNSDEVISHVLQQYSEQKNIRYIVQQNAGLSAVRNRGIDETTGSYLMFLDADDELLPNALQLFRQAIAEYPAAGVLIAAHISAFEDGSEKLSRIKPVAPDCLENFRRYIASKLKLSNGPTLLKRSVFAGLRYPVHLRHGEDTPVFAIALATHQAMTVNQPVAKIHKSQTSMRHDYAKMQGAGLAAIEYLFTHPALPVSCQRFYRQAAARRYLSLSRGAYLANQFADCKSYYLKAFLQAPLSALSLSYLKKFIKALFRHNA